ncbi:RCC1 and BTB domain-containing protein 2-like isoform X2 [Daktulosphaira vitifoliae]|uniref:RCC1 and BTB domain-containing protein 2-like isoform X2 n=1 Tax=Daktulosphaira vitifoliae TaxID=58002 RepID=UPI0021AAAFF8|nr:RCC1 and BTB domain-containing protein 2-like isoform X2 [Daktulosphaira vitifoliae]
MYKNMTTDKYTYLNSNMDMYWCGFNGFNQLNSEHNQNLDFHEYENDSIQMDGGIQYITFSWSSASILTGNGHIFVSGLIHDKKVNFEVLNNDVCAPFISVATSETNILACDTTKKCWSYSKVQRKWSNLTQNLQSEVQVSTSQNKEDFYVHHVYCSDTIHLAVSFHEVYSIPTKIYESQLKVSQVACGFEHVVILMENGSIFSVGSGHGELNEEERPRLLNYLDGIKVISVSAGGWHTAAISECNDLYMWGWNHSGQLGICNSPESNGILIAAEPVLIEWPEETEIEQVSLGSRHSMVLSKKNILWGCGWNAHKQLGIETYELICDRMINLSLLSSLFKYNKKKIVKIECKAWNSAVLLKK